MSSSAPSSPILDSGFSDSRNSSSASFLLTHFDRLAEAPGGIAKLRALIMQLGVQGKLLPQNPADEPAEKLFENITSAAKKRERLARELELECPTSDDCTHAIPSSWIWIRLGQVGDIVGGGTPDSKDASAFSESGIPWLTPADLGGFKNKFISRGRRDLSDKGLASSSARLMPMGTVVFSSRAPIGYVAIAANPLSTNQGFKSVVPHIVETNEFIYLWLKASASEIADQASGTTFKEVSGKIVANLVFPLPPLAEQRRIVAKVEELMGLCDALEAAQREREAVRTRLRTSALHQLASPDSGSKSAGFAIRHFSRITACPEDLAPFRASVLTIAAAGLLTSDATYPQVTFSEVIEELRYGTSRKCAKQPSGTVVLRIPNVVRGEIDFTELKRTEMPEKELRDLALREGDLLIVRSNGSESLVGRVSVVSRNCEGFAYAGYLVRIRLKRESATPAFVQLALSTDAVRSQIEKPIRTTVGVKNINSTEINRLTFPLPPLAEQRRIVAKVDELMVVLDALEAALTTARTTAASLLAATVAALHAA